MADADFKLPTSSYDELMKIVQAYAQINKEASLADISKRIGMNTTTISANNGFLLAVGIISGGKSKFATPIGKQIGDSISHGIESETVRILRSIVEETEFLRNVIGAIRIRRGMDEGALRSHIAYSAGVSKSSSVIAGAGAIIEILRRSGAIQEEDGKFVVGVGSSAPTVGETSQTLPQSHVSAIVDSTVEHVSARQIRKAGSISLSIEVTVNCTPEQLEGLGAKLRAIVDEFSSTEEAAG